MDETLRKKLKRSDISPAEAIQLYIRAGQLDMAHEVISNIRLGSSEFEINLMVKKGYRVNFEDICLDEEQLIAYLSKILLRNPYSVGSPGGWDDDDFDEDEDEDEQPNPDADDDEDEQPSHPILTTLARVAQNKSMITHWPSWRASWEQVLVFTNPLTNSYQVVSSIPVSAKELEKLSRHPNQIISDAAKLYIKHLDSIKAQIEAENKRKEEQAKAKRDRERAKLENSLIVINFQAALDTRIDEMWDLYSSNWDKEDQKDFANAVKHHPLSHLIFRARTENIRKKSKFHTLVRNQDIVRMAHRYHDNMPKETV